MGAFDHVFERMKEIQANLLGKSLTSTKPFLIEDSNVHTFNDNNGGKGYAIKALDSDLTFQTFTTYNGDGTNGIDYSGITILAGDHLEVQVKELQLNSNLKCIVYRL